MTSNENGPFSSIATHQYVAPLEQHAERNRQMPCRARAPAGEAQLAPGDQAWGAPPFMPPFRRLRRLRRSSVASAPLPGFHRWRHCHHFILPRRRPRGRGLRPNRCHDGSQPNKERSVASLKAEFAAVARVQEHLVTLKASEADVRSPLATLLLQPSASTANLQLQQQCPSRN